MTFKQRVLRTNLRIVVDVLFLLLFKINRLLVLKKKNDKVLIICIHKLGDSVLTIRTIEKIIKRYQGNITLLAYESMLPIFKFKFQDELEYIGIKKEDLRFSRIVKKEVKKKIKALDCGTIFDLTGSIIGASLLFNNKAENIIGVNEKIYKGLYDEYYPNEAKNHISDIYLQVIGETYEQFVPIDKNYNRGDPIYIHPTAGWAAKEWGFEKYCELYTLLSKDYNISFLISPDFSEEFLIKLRNQQIRFIITKSTAELINTINESSLLISNDTGPIHLAALLGKPTFSIYGPTNILFHVPKGEIHKTINKQINCTPTSTKYCYREGGLSCKSFDCMKLLYVDPVYKSVKDHLIELNIEKIK